MSVLLARVQMAVAQKQKDLCLDKVIHLLVIPEDHHLGSVQLLCSCGAVKVLDLVSLGKLLPNLGKCNANKGGHCRLELVLS